jgi:glycosyltransferase involved in cell wall biosynthesis
MRITLIAEVFLPKIDGVVQRTMNLLRELTACGDEVQVICPQAPGCDQCAVPVVPVPSFSFPLYPEYRIGLPDESIVAALERFRPEVVHFINPFAFGFVCHDLLQRAGLHYPTVFSFHTLYGEFVKRYRLLRPLSWLLWWLMRDYHNRADVNLTVSSLMQQDLVRRGFERVRLWPPAVDSRLFHPQARSGAMRARLANGSSAQHLLLTVSRLAPEKNVAFLGQLLDQLPDTSLAIVGDGPQRAELERAFAGKNVNFVGYLKGADLAAAYASADAFVYASETETMGNVILEAMACGSAVLAPRAGGIPSLVVPGETALLYEPGDVAAAVGHTRRVLTEPGLGGRLGRAARQCVERWDWTHSISQVRATYAEAIKRFGTTTLSWNLKHSLARAALSTLLVGFQALAPRDQTAQSVGDSSTVAQPRQRRRLRRLRRRRRAVAGSAAK